MRKRIVTAVLLSIAFAAMAACGKTDPSAEQNTVAVEKANDEVTVEADAPDSSSEPVAEPVESEKDSNAAPDVADYLRMDEFEYGQVYSIRASENGKVVFPAGELIPVGRYIVNSRSDDCVFVVHGREEDSICHSDLVRSYDAQKFTWDDKDTKFNSKDKIVILDGSSSEEELIFLEEGTSLICYRGRVELLLLPDDADAGGTGSDWETRTLVENGLAIEKGKWNGNVYDNGQLHLRLSLPEEYQVTDFDPYSDVINRTTLANAHALGVWTAKTDDCVISMYIHQKEKPENANGVDPTSVDELFDMMYRGLSGEAEISDDVYAFQGYSWKNGSYDTVRTEGTSYMEAALQNGLTADAFAHAEDAAGKTERHYHVEDFLTETDDMIIRLSFEYSREDGAYPEKSEMLQQLQGK